MAAQDKVKTTSTRTTSVESNRGTSSRASRSSSTDAPSSTVAPSTPVPAPEPSTPVPTSAPVPTPVPTPVASPRNDVEVNVSTIQRAFVAGTASQSVAFIQHALRERGVRLTRTDGIADQDTRAAYAAYQDSIREEPTGLPTEASLDLLGFTVVG